MKNQDELAQAVNHVARQLSALGTNDAATHMGAIEYLTTEIKEGLDGVASAIHDLADAIRETGFNQ